MNNTEAAFRKHMSAIPCFQNPSALFQASLPFPPFNLSILTTYNSINNNYHLLFLLSAENYAKCFT